MQQAGKSDDLPDTGDEVAHEMLSVGIQILRRHHFMSAASEKPKRVAKTGQ